MPKNKTMSFPFCGEIEYDGVHSDICFSHDHSDMHEVTEDYRKFLHDCLDEWIDQGHGNGIFWVGDPTVWEAVRRGEYD